MDIRSFSLIAISLFSTVTPAYAQGYAKEKPMIQTGHLQPVQFFHSRPQVGIEDNGPIVTDWRRRLQDTQVVVAIPPLPQQSTTALPAGAVTAGRNIYVVPGSPGGIGSANPMLGNRSYLQDAGPRSYINQHPVAANRGLPSAATTGIHGQMKAPPHAIPAATAPEQLKSPGYFAKPITNMAGDPLPLKYSEQNVSVGNSSSRHVKTDTSVKIINMLGKIK